MAHVAPAPSIGTRGTSNTTPRWLFVLPWELHLVGGVNQVVINLARAFALRTDIEPLIGINRWGQTRPEHDEHAGLPVLRLWSPQPWTERRPLIGALRYILRLPATLCRLFILLRGERVAVVNIHYLNIAALNWLLLRKLGLFQGQVILSLHGRDLRNSLHASRAERALWRYMLCAADSVVACSAGLQAEIEQAYDLPAGTVVTIHNGIDVHLLEATRVTARPAGAIIPTRRRYIVNVGTYEHKKGHDILIEAFRRIASLYPDLDLVIVGRSGDTFDATCMQVAKAGLASRVHLLRDQPHGDTLAIIKQADVFVLSSRNEAFAMVLLEASAFGTPIIATDVCGVAELLGEHGHGRIVAPDDPAALATAIREFFDHPAPTPAIETKMRQLVLQQFTWHQRSEEYLELMQNAAVRV